MKNSLAEPSKPLAPTVSIPSPSIIPLRLTSLMLTRQEDPHLKSSLRALGLYTQLSFVTGTKNKSLERTYQAEIHLE